MKIAGSHYAIDNDTFDVDTNVDTDNDDDNDNDDATPVQDNSPSSKPSTSTLGSSTSRRSKVINRSPLRSRLSKDMIQRIDDVVDDDDDTATSNGGGYAASLEADEPFEQSPSMLTATDDEFSFQSHPSQDTSFDTLDDDAIDDDRATRRQFAGATIAGAVAGLVLGGPLGAVAVAASSAYAVNSKSPAGSIIRKGGESVANLGDRVLEHEKAKESLKRGEATMARARGFFLDDTNHKLLQKMNVAAAAAKKKTDKNDNDTTTSSSSSSFRQRALCCSSFLMSRNDRAAACVEESVDDANEDFYLQTVETLESNNSNHEDDGASYRGGVRNEKRALV